MGVTGSGKTFTMAHTIARVEPANPNHQHNKTLAAQLYEEMKDLFRTTRWGNFVSYYDTTSPSVHPAARHLYREGCESKRTTSTACGLAPRAIWCPVATSSSSASVSCTSVSVPPSIIRSRSSPSARASETIATRLLRKLITFSTAATTWTQRGHLPRARRRRRAPSILRRVRLPHRVLRRRDPTIDAINPLTGELLMSHEPNLHLPAVHYVMAEERVHGAVQSIREELDKQVMHLRSQGKLLEAQRLLAANEIRFGDDSWSRLLLGH